MAFDYDAARKEMDEILKKLPDPDAPDTTVQMRVQIMMLPTVTEMGIAGLRLIHEHENGSDGTDVVKGLAGSLSSVIINWAQQFSDPEEAGKALLASVVRRLAGEAKVVLHHETQIPEKGN